SGEQGGGYLRYLAGEGKARRLLMFFAKRSAVSSNQEAPSFASGLAEVFPTTRRQLKQRFRGEAGYSLVEVMASIVILAIAIIPMVGMLDMGLKTATSGSNYDRARALANTNLEKIKA